MQTSFIYFLFNALALAIFGLVIFWYLKKYKKKAKQEAGELAKCEQKKDNIYETISGLTALSGVRSTLDYIASNLQKLGFPKILIFIVDKKNRTLELKITRGFSGDLDPEEMKVPISSSGGLVNQSLFENKFFVHDDEGAAQNPKLEFKNLSLASFMVAPIARKGDDKCWEMFHCGNASCPSFEDEETFCWTVPETKCQSHLKASFDEKIFQNPSSKLEACLTCERFQSLGVILVARSDFIKFSSDDKKLFRTLAYQAGVKLERAFLLSHLEERERELTRRMYEVSILKELGERIGYSLNTQKIADIITGSLKKLIDYSAVSYLLINPDQKKLIFSCQLEEAVNHSFIDSVKQRTLAGLSALLNQELDSNNIEESLAGTVLNDNLITPVRSFFNIPLTLGEKVVGMLNVASTRPGLYREEEMTILYKITAQASNAVTRLHNVLSTEQERINAMVSSMADGVLMVDKENRIYVINPKVKKMLGLDKKDVSIFDIYNSFSHQVDFRTKLEECLKLDRLVITDEVYINNYFLKILFSPVKNKVGEILGAVTIFHDVTHDKELEKMREDFNHMMVHDLRSPLNGIRLMSELLQKKEQPKEELKKSVALIHQSTSHMLELVNDLLDIAKLESGKFALNKQLDNLPELIYNQIDFFRPLAQDKNINLTTQLAKNLPPLKFDRREIKQALSNLMSNAVKFTDPGGNVLLQLLSLPKGGDIEQQALLAGINWFLTKENKVISAWDKNGVICAVTDSGCGIAEQELSKLFNKFTQAESSKGSKEKGTGLGLVIAKGIIESHAGVIGVESKLDKGSTFFFILPVE